MRLAVCWLTLAVALGTAPNVGASLHQRAAVPSPLGDSGVEGLSLHAEGTFAAFLERARSAELVVEVSVERTTVEDLLPRGLSSGRLAQEGHPTQLLPATRARVRVHKSFHPDLVAPGELLEVLVPGGRWQSGALDVAAFVEAAPQLRDGDQFLLLLERWRGAFTPVDLRAGTARIDRSSAAVYLEPAAQLVPATRVVQAVRLDALERDLASVLRRGVAEPSEHDPAGERGTPHGEVRDGLQSVGSEFALTLSPDALPPFGCGDGGGNPLRWFEFERGEVLDVFAQAAGQPGVPGGGFSAVSSAIGAWNNDAGSGVLLRYGGTTPATQAIAGLDGLSTIAFEDPGDQVPGSFPNRTLLALTVAFFDCSRLLGYASGLAHPLVEFGIVTQNGVGSFFFGNLSDPSTTLAELLAHEIGHGIGFAHPCDTTPQNPCVGAEDLALMRGVLHQNGRGATLASDDRAALAFLYPLPSGNPPVAPTALSTVASSSNSVTLSWQAGAGEVAAFEVEARSVGERFIPVATVSSSASSFDLAGLDAETPQLFRLRARSAGGLSTPSNEAAATPQIATVPCVADEQTLCLNNGRFLARSFYATEGESGSGTGAILTEDTGTFWFFDPSNVELIVKALDACSQFGHYWVFAGALTDVETALLVGDTTSGATRTYFNPPATAFQPVQDTVAFPNCP